MSNENPITELRDSLDDFSLRCRVARWFGALFRVGVLQDIEQEVEVHEQAIESDAHKSEVLDLEAEQLLRVVLADTRLPREDRERIVKAVALVHRSAEADHNISELAHV